MTRSPIRSVRRFVDFTARAGVISAAVALAGPGQALAEAPIRGDSDGSGVREITDAILVLNFLFLGGRAPVCLPAADANGDTDLNLSDAVFLLSHLFLGGPAPPPLTPAEAAECGGTDPAAIARGYKEFETDDPDGNSMACATCHTMAPDAGAEVHRPGYTLLDSLVRPGFKEGKRATFGGAVNVCRKDWMQVSDAISGDYIPWAEDEPRLKDLMAFIESLSSAESSPALAYEIVAPKTGPATGNADEGCKVFAHSCRACHGVDASGNKIGSNLIDVEPKCTEKPDLCLDGFCQPDKKCLDDPDFIRYRLRLSGPLAAESVYTAPPGLDFAGTTMPFWTKEKLSDTEIEDVVAFIAVARQAARNSQPTPVCTPQPSPDGAVKRRGTLENTSHGVEGVVEDLDTARIRITNFSFGGRGIEVRVVLTKSGSDAKGLAIGPDLFGDPKAGTTLVIELPNGVDSSSFDTVSIRDVLAGVDFGSAALQPVAQ